MFSEWIVEALHYLNISAVITHTAFYCSSEITERKKERISGTLLEKIIISSSFIIHN
jgi:hypothetical protein